MRRPLMVVMAAAALVGAGCGSDDEPYNEQAPAPPGVQTTATTEAPTITPTPTRTTADGELSPEGRAVLDASQDLAADVSETAEDFARGRIDQDEAVARLDLARERAEDLRGRVEQLPASDRARQRLVSLNEEISNTAAAISEELRAGRAASRDDIDRRIEQLRDEARSTFDAVTRQLDRQTRDRLGEALERIDVEP